jgi:predicted transposase YbfD/YdcC
MTAVTVLPKRSKKEQLAERRESAAAKLAESSEARRTAESKYRQIASQAEKLTEDHRLTSAQLFAWLRSGEPLAEEGWQERWRDSFDRLAKELGSVVDPRDPRGFRHPLVSVLALPVLASICGRDGADASHLWGLRNERWLKEFLPLPHGIPSQDAILRVYAAVDTRQFELAFLCWIEGFARESQPGRQIAVDGQRLRRGGQGEFGEEEVHSLSALDCESGVVIGRRTTDVKSNEITALPKLLGLLNIRGALVSTDAMGCQTAVAEAILAGGGNYLFGLKGNQLGLDKEAKAAFAYALGPKPKSVDAARPLRLHKDPQGAAQNVGHGRIEERTAIVIRRSDDPDRFDRWLPTAARFKGIESIIRVEATRTNRNTGESSTEVRYYISSAGLTAKAANEAVRKHWHVENRLHWVLDVTFGADQCRIRTLNAAANFACARQMALTILRMHQGDKLSMAVRRNTANDWPDYLAWLLDSL